MANGFKEISPDKRKTDRMWAAGLGILAAIVYGLTVAKGVFPGESAQLMAVYSGIEPLNLPLHPVWGKMVGCLSMIPVFSLPLRLNLFSVCCAVVSVVLLYRLMSFLIYDVITEEYSVEYAQRVSYFGGAFSALAFLFAVPVWSAATRLQYQSFDLMLVLVAATLLVAYAKSRAQLFLIFAAFLLGAGIVESEIFVPLFPVFVAFFALVLWKHGSLSLKRIVGLGVFFLAGVSLYYFVARHFFVAHDSEALEFKSSLDVMTAVWKTQILRLKSGLPRNSWLLLLLMSVVPWVAAGFASFRALNNERSWSQYILHLTLSVLVGIGLLNTAISPWEILKPLGRLPVWAYAMLAMTAGYLVAYWYLLLKVARPKRGLAISVLAKQTGDWMGLLLTYPMAALVLVAAVINAFECRGSRGAFADRCAKEILDRMGARTWLITDGTLDPHLQIMAKARGQELNLVCLQKDMSRPYLKRMAKLIETKKLFNPADLQRMKSTLDLGVLPFVQDWFAMDPAIEKKAAVFGVPDFWYTAGLAPISDFLFFSGSRDIQTLKDRPLYKDYMTFWKSMDGVLAPGKAGDADPTVRLRVGLRRHMGFVANNLGVLLEDLGKEEEAFAVYTYVHDQIDPENISALFNRFEMARRNVPAASAQKEAIERELKKFIGTLKQKYPLWSLSRYYGYVRSPEIFARLGWGWALSGQTGAALAGVKRAGDLLPADKRGEAMQALAAVYELADDRNKTRTIYKDIIKNDPDNRSALLGLARMAVQEGAVDKAKQWLEKAAKADDKRGALGVEWAVIYLMNNDMAHARLTLQETTDLQPKNLQAWAMLAMVQLQQNEVSDIEKVMLPKMENIAGTVDNYFIQITKAQLALKKGKGFEHQAREAFIRASMLRPDISGVKDMILQLDIAMNDQKNAELHARQVLRANRKHALANYVMGSLRLKEGSYGDAEDFLRRSVAANPTAASLNDLAEVLRRIRKFGEAEQDVREALKLNPKLYVAWETLAAILLESGKDLNEAEQAVRKAIELYGDDPRIRITLARVLLKKGEIERARETIRQIKSRQGELSAYDQETLAKLANEASSHRNP